MQCELSGVPTSVLLDNGAQVSIVSEKYLLENFINAATTRKFHLQVLQYSNYRLVMVRLEVKLMFHS